MSRTRAGAGERGFTLIEVVTVVMVVGILLAVAVPVYLGARERAQVRTAQANLREALVAAQVYFAEHESYSTSPSGDATAGIAALNAIEPSLTFQSGASTGPRVVRVKVDDVSTPAVTNGMICLTVEGGNGARYTVRQISAGDRAGTAYRVNGNGNGCPGNPVGVNGWQERW